MNTSNKILSDITVFSKYAKYIPELQRRETWHELVTRNKEMHQRKYPKMKKEIEKAYKLVYEKKCLPSMRALQFGGAPIELAPNRIYNCAYLPIESTESFAESMFLLLGGTGVGYSVQRHHVRKLPEVVGPKKRKRRFLVSDNIEGWADAVKVLCESYFYNMMDVEFDYRDIRPKGAMLITTGGKAPGPQPLKDCIHNMRSIFDQAVGRQLTTLEVHDMMCYIADAVLTGGIRRAAMISLFSMDDSAMLGCKSGSWWEQNPQRARANNSAVILRHKITKESFDKLWERVRLSGSGEPGIYLTNDKDWGTNPCCEIGLRPYQMCNLTEMNVSDITSQKDLNERARAASLIGTLQAGYTDFHYLRPEWQETCEREALIGVGQTGIGSGTVLEYDLEEAAEEVKKENERVAKLLGINCAARCTTVKPSGTSSCVLGSSSGIHAWHNDYYIRRQRIGKNEALYGYFAEHHPELVEDEYFKPEEQAVIEIPQAAPEGSILRNESPIDLLNRVGRYNTEWVAPGHREGQNSHNVSCTISIKDDEWELVGEWMWKNRYHFNGISVLPYDGGTYVQAPFEDITEERYRLMENALTGIDLTRVQEVEDKTDLSAEAACAGGACEITY